MSHRMLSNWITCILTLMFICAAFRTAAAQPENAEDIRRNMAYLKPLIGNWDASADFHLADGGTARRRGSYKIASVLDDTYLQWDVTLWSENDPSRRHSFLIFITYNPATKKYDCTYFYSRSALRVTETGEYDNERKQFRTSAYVPLEDGVRDENVRTITTIADNSVNYVHYSRYNDEKNERMDLEIRLTRAH